MQLPQSGRDTMDDAGEQDQSTKSSVRVVTGSGARALSTGIDPTTFYGRNTGTPPELPRRRNTAGSSHTKFYAPSAAPEPSPPQYATWREPELVEDDASMAVIPNESNEQNS